EDLERGCGRLVAVRLGEHPDLGNCQAALPLPFSPVVPESGRLLGSTPLRFAAPPQARLPYDSYTTFNCSRNTTMRRDASPSTSTFSPAARSGAAATDKIFWRAPAQPT